MRYIENISKGVKLPSKIEHIVNKTNKILLDNFESPEVLETLMKNFNKLVSFSKHYLNSINEESDFEEFILNFEQIFKKLEVEKLHNNTAKSNLKKFSEKDLFYQLFSIVTPLNSKYNISFIKGGLCYSWAIFFYNFFSKVDKENRLKKRLLLFYPSFFHGAFEVGFKNKSYILDPYAKGTGLVTEVKKNNKIYLGTAGKELLFGQIKHISPLILEIGNKQIKVQKFTQLNKFIENIISTKKELINIKTYLRGESIHLVVRHNLKYIFINKNGEQFYREKDFALIDVVGLFMQYGNKVSTRDLLLALIGFSKENLSENELKKFEILAEKIEWDFVFKQLGIQEDIKMFI